MPRIIQSFYLEDFELFGNQFCEPGNITKDGKTYSIIDITRLIDENCPMTCKNELISTEIKQKFHPNKIKINFIPKFNAKPIFTFSLKINFNKFVYDLGGIIGMWIGWSALTIPLYIYGYAQEI